MKAGMVIRMRVGTKDCMSIVDIAKQVGISDPERYSFSALCSLVLSSLLEVQRKMGTIPERDGFEYMEMMAPYRDRQGRMRQEMTSLLYKGRQDRAREEVGTGETMVEMQKEFQALHDRLDSLTGEEKKRYDYLNNVIFG